MTKDEQEIRELVGTWMKASQAGDAETVLGLVTDDVVFLRAGHAPLRKDGFEAQSRAQAGAGGSRVEARSEIQEVQVAGDWAFMWTKLAVTMTPADGGAAMERAGHTLTVLRREGGRWRIARDANLLAPVKGA